MKHFAGSRYQKRSRILALVLAAACAALFLASVCIGRYQIPVADALGVFFGKTEGLPATVVSIVGNSRIPRAAAALLVGMAMSASGVSYQSVFTNPMAAPDILGAASGSACGAAIGILLSNSDAVVQLMAFLMGLGAVMLTLTVSRIISKGRSTVIYLILVGMVVSALFKSGISLVKYFADVENTLPAITFWLMGGLTNVTNKQLMFAAPIIIVCLAAVFLMRWDMNLLSFGDEEAMAIGINVRISRMKIIIAATLMSSAAISLSGLIGWVGIAAPHICRMVIGANNRYLLPVAIFFGGIFVTVIDLIARMMLTVEIPLGILTAIVGAPIFLWILFRGDFLGGSE